MKRVARSAIVAHPARALYDLVEDVESYPGFLPWCRGVQVHARDPGHTRATLSLGLGPVSQSITTANTNRPGEAIDMRLVEGPFRSFSGTWRFAALGEGAAQVRFTLEYEFSSRVVAALLEPLFERIADSILDAFVRRADAVHGKPAR